MYQNTQYIFSQIDPSKKYGSFDFYEISKLEDVRFYMEKNMIVECGGVYYQYKGEKCWNSSIKIDTKILVKNGRKEVAVFNY